jgi:uncharacterized protein with FMN-binding domain
MKKALVTVGVIGIFVVYGLLQKANLVADTIPSTPTPAPSKTPIPGAPTSTPIPTTSNGQYKDGVYTGPAADALYGLVQVQVTVSGGKISDVQFLQFPNDRRTSQMINSQVMPMLKNEAIQAQSGDVNIVSGATDTSMAFIQSLTSALQSAVNN